MHNARILSAALEATKWYECVSSIHRKKGTLYLDQDSTKSFSDISANAVQAESSSFYNPGLPVVSFRLSDQFAKEYPHVKQENVSVLLRAKGYIIPNYPLPPAEDKIEILRVVVRESMSLDLIDRLVADIMSITENLMASDAVNLRAFTSGGSTHQDDKKDGTSEMEGGVHRSVC
jgi:glutamate decarboxylase